VYKSFSFLDVKETLSCIWIIITCPPFLYAFPIRKKNGSETPLGKLIKTNLVESKIAIVKEKGILYGKSTNI